MRTAPHYVGVKAVTRRVGRTIETVPGNAGDPKFRKLLARLDERIAGAGPLFTTDADNLWTTYLRAFDSGVRQYHNCNECRHFMERFGGLVVVDNEGRIVPALWSPDAADVQHLKAYKALYTRVSKAKITGVFLSEESTLADNGGSPAWEHFAVRNPHPYRGTIKNADQAAAEKLEDFKNVSRALDEFSAATVKTALSLLSGDALYRSEKVLGPCQFLADLHAHGKGPRRKNHIWAAVASAPAGFCHPRSSMIGTLLEDIESGLPFPEVSRRFRDKMHPLQYQRPTAPPKVGNIAQAEKIVEQLGVASAFRRRFARLDECETFWTPQPVMRAGGVFGHLLQPQVYRGGSQTMTWVKFREQVLPSAHRIEVDTPFRGNYTALVTAVDPTAPHIFQWDNPYSWYVYNGGSNASQWGVSGWTQVNAITASPANWFGGHFPHQGERACLILDGCRDSGNPTSCLFPEILKTEFHGIRSVIEAHSNKTRMEGFADASACGICLHQGAFDVKVRVTDSAGIQTEYRLDRWD